MPVQSPFPAALIDDTYLPDRSAEIDLITAEDENKKRASLRDISAVLGINPQGAAESVAARIAALESGANVPQILTVAPSGAEFDTITDALDSIDDNAIDKQYIIQLFPGVYNDEIELKPFVHIIGMQPQVSMLYPTQAKNVAIITNGYSPFICDNAGYNIIENVYIEVTGANIFHQNNVVSVSTDIVLNHCIVKQLTASNKIITGPTAIKFFLNQTKFLHTANTSLIISYDTSVDETFTLYAYRSSIYGTINIIESDDGGINAKLMNSFFNGSIICDAGTNYVDMHFSGLNGNSNHGIQLGTANEAIVNIYHSLINNGSDKKPVHRLSGTSLIQVEAAFSMFETAFGDDVNLVLGPSLNVVDANFHQAFYPIR